MSISDNIPCSCSEVQLLPLLLKAGEICRLSFIPNYKNQRVSYAFATYFNIKSVEYAFKLLNGFEIDTGRKLDVARCRCINKLFIGTYNVYSVVIFVDLKLH